MVLHTQANITILFEFVFNWYDGIKDASINIVVLVMLLFKLQIIGQISLYEEYISKFYVLTLSI